MDRNKITGTLLVIISAMTFGSLPLFSNFAYAQGIPVSTLLFLRFFTASLILWPYVLIKKLPFKTSKYVFGHLLLISFIGYASSASGLFYAYKYISSSLATIIIYCYPIIVVGYEMFSSKKIDYKKIFCLLITLLGLVLVVCTGPIKMNWTGILLAFISAVGYAYFCIGLEKKETQTLNSIVISTYVMSSCMIVYFLQCIITKQTLLPPNTKSFSYAVILGILCSIVPTVTLYEGVKKIGVGTSVIISTFEPLFVCILGVIFLNEIVTSNMIIGGLLVIFSLMLLQMPTLKFPLKNKRRTIYNSK
ncbi:DMT family transporter [Clostridium ganghwense]|uniref:DMT family transporter n=1 Tax=Clostridium ganghwense TaxID=312089 RepID=A0ABT4CKA2_9CLOT|nr:DMT family transporter [Clostridium ganghwense]MCY6369472.1 DMT family transporter [Clostridium ganghwense]